MTRPRNTPRGVDRRGCPCRARRSCRAAPRGRRSVWWSTWRLALPERRGPSSLQSAPVAGEERALDVVANEAHRRGSRYGARRSARRVRSGAVVCETWPVSRRCRLALDTTWSSCRVRRDSMSIGDGSSRASESLAERHVLDDDRWRGCSSTQIHAAYRGCADACGAPLPPPVERRRRAAGRGDVRAALRGPAPPHRRFDARPFQRREEVAASYRRACRAGHRARRRSDRRRARGRGSPSTVGTGQPRRA